MYYIDLQCHTVRPNHDDCDDDEITDKFKIGRGYIQDTNYMTIIEDDKSAAVSKAYTKRLRYNLLN